MLTQRLEPLDFATAVALAVLWAAGFGIALAFGEAALAAAGMSFLAIACLSIGYLIVDAATRELVSQPIGAIGVFAVGCLMAAFSFAGDCVVGSMRAHDMPFLQACVEKSGFGFAFTVLCIAMAVGIPVLGLTRSAVAKVWQREGNSSVDLTAASERSQNATNKHCD